MIRPMMLLPTLLGQMGCKGPLKPSFMRVPLFGAETKLFPMPLASPRTRKARLECCIYQSFGLLLVLSGEERDVLELAVTRASSWRRSQPTWGHLLLKGNFIYIYIYEI